jgi:hypothetical protein
MIDPAAAKIGQMIIDYGPIFIFGTVVIVALTALAIKKLGLFNKNEKPVLELGQGGRCGGHEKLMRVVNKVETQIAKVQTQQNANMSALKNGKNRFETLHGEIEVLKIGLYVLIAQSGAEMPEVLKGVKVK